MVQDTFISEEWGMLTFVEMNGSNDKRCRHCLLRPIIQECIKAPCSSQQRQDNKSGYFTIHQMPKGE